MRCAGRRGLVGPTYVSLLALRKKGEANTVIERTNRVVAVVMLLAVVGAIVVLWLAHDHGRQRSRRQRCVGSAVRVNTRRLDRDYKPFYDSDAVHLADVGVRPALGLESRDTRLDGRGTERRARPVREMARRLREISEVIIRIVMATVYVTIGVLAIGVTALHIAEGSTDGPALHAVRFVVGAILLALGGVRLWREISEGSVPRWLSDVT